MFPFPMACAVRAMGAAALFALAACTAWPSMQVAYALPNTGAVSSVVQRVWMNSDGGIRSEVIALLQTQLSDPADSARNKLDLERLGFDCAAAIQPRCTHASKVEYQPTGPAPHGGTAPRAVKILISTALKNPVTEVSVQKTNETKSGPK